jgi:hypothetical protein
MTGTSPSAYDLNDLQSDIGHMAQLMDVIADIVVEGPISVGGPCFQRLNSLVWIARDMAQRLEDQTSEHFLEIATTRGGRQV